MRPSPCREAGTPCRRTRCPPLRRGAANLHFCIVPGTGRGKRLVEHRDEIKRVVTAPIGLRQIPAEVAAADRTADGSRLAIDRDRRIAAADFRIRSAHEKGGRFPGRERETGDAAAQRSGEFHRHAVGQFDAVIAGGRVFTGVREVTRVNRVVCVGGGRVRDRNRYRHERDVATGAGAAGARKMRQAEAADAGRVILIATRCGGAVMLAPGVFGAPLQHPERQAGAWKGVATCGCRSAD